MRSTLRLVAALAVAALAGCAHEQPPPPAPAVQIGQWNANHPEAARDLCVWMQRHPDAAHKFFEWDAAHSAQSKEFVGWVLMNPGQGIDGFVGAHQNWEKFDVMTEVHRPAANEFIAWIRHYPEAARALMDHPAGLAWAGKNLAC